jgi:hypothetical protein
MDTEVLRERIRQAGLDLGFAQVGFAPAETPLHANQYLRWLEIGGGSRQRKPFPAAVLSSWRV